MVRFIVRRLLWMIPTLLIVTFLVFVAIRVGTNPVAAYLRLNPRASPEKVAQFKHVNGLEGSIPNQYFSWLRRFLTWDWPRSIAGNRPVWPNLKDALANSFVLGGLATVVGIGIGLVVGILAALRQYSKFDTAASTSAFVGISIPPYVSAVLLQLLFAVYFTRWLGLHHPFLPTSGVYPPGHRGFDIILRLKHLILPTIVVAIQIIAIYTRYMRASLLDVISSDYLRTARAKGISERRVIVSHALRNALIPIVTVATIDIAGIVGGLIITEGVFEYPGAGKFFLNAYTAGDFPSLMPWMVIVVVFVVLFNLLADVLYAWLDPRIRLE
ncbi:MAG: ABC transporter permease [Acidimicrobiales bacterium]